MVRERIPFDFWHAPMRSLMARWVAGRRDRYASRSSDSRNNVSGWAVVILGRSVTIPTLLAVEAGLIDAVPSFLRRAHLVFDACTVVSGSGPTRDVADRVAASLP